LKVVYVPQAEILHQTSSTTSIQSENYIYYFARNRIRFMRRRASWPLLLVVLLFHSFVRLPAALVVFGLIRGRLGVAWAFVKGRFDGMTGR
jgi:GT2 family glycosyltransferase